MPRISKALVAAAFLALSLMTPGADAANPRGSIHIHARLCPQSMPAGSNIYDQCHETAGPDGSEFTVDRRIAKDIDSDGNVSFGRVTSGDHLITLTSDFQPNEFLRVRAFCSNLATGTGPNEATILHGDQAQFWVRVAPGSQLVCDVYFMPVSGR